MSDDGTLKQCAHCASYIPVEATMCASCGTSDVDGARARERGAQPSAARAVSVRLPRGWTVTRTLVWMNVAYMFVALYVQHSRTPDLGVHKILLSFTGLSYGNAVAGAYIHPLVAEGQWWRAIAAFFLHGGLLHIGMNMWVLSRLGPFLEDMVGPVRFLVIYLVSGIGSTLTISIWFAFVAPYFAHLLGFHAPTMVGMVGASGAIFGVMGALATYVLRVGNLRGQALGKVLWRDIVMMLLIGLFVPVISNTGHVGGLLPGVAFGLFMGSRFMDRVRPQGQRPWLIAAALLSAITLLALTQGIHFSFQNLGGR